ncbi:MAG TPA: hypothetical protein VJA47_02530 [archaeon]|nr:hypothetical protein [archaeon]
MPIDTLTKSRVVYVTFCGAEIPDTYRGQTKPVSIEGDQFCIGDEALTGPSGITLFSE